MKCNEIIKPSLSGYVWRTRSTSFTETLYSDKAVCGDAALYSHLHLHVMWSGRQETSGEQSWDLPATTVHVLLIRWHWIQLIYYGDFLNCFYFVSWNIIVISLPFLTTPKCTYTIVTVLYSNVNCKVCIATLSKGFWGPTWLDLHWEVRVFKDTRANQY